MTKRTGLLVETIGAIILGGSLFVLARLLKIEPALLISIVALNFAIQALIEKKDKE